MSETHHDPTLTLKYNARQHSYWLNGKRCKSPSAIAKVPDDSSALDKWRRRQTAIGLAMRPELLAEIATNADNKTELDAICERAMTHSGADSGRNWGSAVHLAIEKIIAGSPILETPDMALVRTKWTTLLEANGLEVVASEQVVVHPELMIAGRFDQVVVDLATGKHHVADVKTGEEADKYLHAHCVQLWLYASAPWTAQTPQGDVDFEITEFVPALPIDQEVGYVLHLPREGDPSVIPVDLAAGKQCFEEVIKPTWAWRNRKDLKVVRSPDAKPAKPRRITPQEAPTATPAPTPDEGATVDVDALRGRYKALSDADKDWIGRLWEAAQKAGLSFHLKDHPTARRAAILEGLVILAEAEMGTDDVAAACADFVVEGAPVGRLDAVTAQLFVEACRSVATGAMGLKTRLDGTSTLVEVAA